MDRTSSSVVEALAAHAVAQSDKLCVADGSKFMTYEQTWRCVCGFAGELRRWGCERRNVAIECNQRIEFVVCVLAAQLAGAVAVPIEKNAAASRVAEIVAETEAIAFIGDPSREVAATRVEDIARALECADAPASGECAFPDGEDVAEILFSTGTTGKSKGIVITHRNNMAIAENIICGVEMKPSTIEIVPMPLSHSHGLRTTYANIVNGSSVVLADGVLALKKLFMLMDEYRVTAMDVSPSMLSIIFKLSKDRLSEYQDVLDYVELGSAPLAEADKENLARLLPRTRLYNFYGSTEAGRSCLYDFATMAGKPGCIGRPAVNASFIVVDDLRNPIDSSLEHPGLLASTGDINMRCYFKEPELTAQTMQDGFLYTKDLGYIGDDGLVYMLGRVDDVINFGGVKISPEEIESAVADNPIVRDCACVPLPDALTGQVPLLCVSLVDGAEYDQQAFKRFLSSALDANKQPQRVEILDDIPRTFNGKIKRKELVSRFESGLIHG